MLGRRGRGRFASPLMWRRKRSLARARPGRCGLGCGCQFTRRWRVVRRWSAGRPRPASMLLMVHAGRARRPSLHLLLPPTARGFASSPSCIRLAITAIRELSIMKATCATTALACWDRRRPRTWSGSPGFRAAGFNSGGRGFTPASSPRFISFGPRRRPNSWTPWFSVKSRSCATRPAPSTSARGRITCWWFRE